MHARPRARGAVAVPGRLPEVRAQDDRRGLAVRVARAHQAPAEPEPEAATDPDVAALLDEAESIVNEVGFQLLAEEERKAKRKLFRKKKRKR